MAEQKVATDPCTYFTGKPDNYKTHDLLPGDKIPEGGKTRPYYLGKPKEPATPVKKAPAKKATVKK